MKELEYTGQGIPKGRRFCTICGEVKRVNHFEGDSDHCMDCCEKMLHTKLHWYAFPALLAALCCTAAAIYLLLETVPAIRAVHSADAAAADCRLYEAQDAYETARTVLEEANKVLYPPAEGETRSAGTLFEFGTRSWEKYLRVCADAETMYEAAVKASDSLDKTRMRKNEFCSALLAKKQAYDTVYSKVSQISQQYPTETPEDMQYDKIIAAMDDFAAQSKDPDIKGYVEYFKASAAQFHDPQDSEAIERYMQKMLTFLPDEYVNAYVSQAQLSLSTKQYDAAIKAADRLLDKNKDHAEAYAWKADALFRKGDKDAAQTVLDAMQQAIPDDPLYDRMMIRFALLNGDTDAAYAASNACDEANSEIADGVFNALLAQKPETVPEKAIRTYLHYIDYSLYEAALMLVMDDADSAFNIAYNYSFNYAYYYAYILGDGSALTQGVINMTTLCAQMNKSDTSTEALSAIAEIGLCDAATQQVIDGKYSVRDVFVDGKVEIL